MLRGWILESGVTEIKPSTITNLRRKLSVEFGDSLHMIQNESNKLSYPLPIYPYAGSAGPIKPPPTK